MEVSQNELVVLLLKGRAPSHSATVTQLLPREDGLWLLVWWFGAWREARFPGEVLLQLIFPASHSLSFISPP